MTRRCNAGTIPVASHAELLGPFIIFMVIALGTFWASCGGDIFVQLQQYCEGVHFNGNIGGSYSLEVFK